VKVKDGRTRARFLNVARCERQQIRDEVFDVGHSGLQKRLGWLSSAQWKKAVTGELDRKKEWAW
jgi:hypothetical protein